MYFASIDRCKSWVSKLYSLKSYWRPRDAYGLFTLGAAAYIDAPDQSTSSFFRIASSYDKYSNLLKADNKILLNNFSEVYSQLELVIASYLGIADDAVAYSDCKALPGFIIYTPNLAYQKTSTHIPHYDLPYKNLSWAKETHAYHFSPNPSQTLSFTLPLQLPSSSSSLRIWNLKRHQAIAMEKNQLRATLKFNKSKEYKYEIGKILIHSGNDLHQVRPWKYIENDSYRVTLQGHGLKVDNRWILYL